MKISKRLLLLLVIVMSCGIYSASAQIYVTLRPSRPVYVRTEAPSPRHVWIDEDWEERDGTYVSRGGYWAEPPHEGDRYTPGRWDHSEHGHQWHEGHWGHEEHGNHEHHEDHGNHGNHDRR